jgi:hypothetical protein
MKPVGTSVQQGSQIETNTQSEASAPDVETTSPSQGEGQGQPVMPKHLNKIKLPKLSLFRFSGDPTKWVPFWDSFLSAIDENNDLNDVDKFQYLRSLLEGSAVNAIFGLSLTNSNYKEAVALLKDRFGNKQVIISKHMKSLMQLPVVTDNDDLKKLRLLYDKSESTVRSLNSIGISQESYGRFLAPTIMAKLTKELRITISRKLSDEWDLKSLLKYFVKNCSYRRNIICVL